MFNRFAVTAQYSNIPSFQVLAGNGRAFLMLTGRAGGLSPIYFHLTVSRVQNQTDVFQFNLHTLLANRFEEAESNRVFDSTGTSHSIILAGEFGHLERKIRRNAQLQASCIPLRQSLASSPPTRIAWYPIRRESNDGSGWNYRGLSSVQVCVPYLRSRGKPRKCQLW
jgi:hypothetical protein